MSLCSVRLRFTMPIRRMSKAILDCPFGRVLGTRNKSSEGMLITSWTLPTETNDSLTLSEVNDSLRCVEVNDSLNSGDWIREGRLWLERKLAV